MKNLKLTKKITGICLLSTTIAISSLSGCAKKMDCDIETEHAHKYISEEGYFTYKDSEYEIKDDMSWTDEITDMNSEVEALDKFDLIKIDDNLEALEKEMSNDKPYIEYEYSYLYTTFISTGKSLIPISHTGYDYTTDKNYGSLTGYVRDVDYKYRSYKIITTKKGVQKIEESELVDDITTIKDEYPYFKLSDYKEKVYSKPYELGKVMEKSK